jgi:hypothetical protein
MFDDEAEDRIKAVTRSPEAYERLYARFFKPYETFLKVDGYNGVSQVWDKSEAQLLSFCFPIGFQATTTHFDIAATQHEMGHFVTVAENRAVRVAFGFGGGMPELGWNPMLRMPINPASANVEAKAIAWEIILLRDMHGIDADVTMMASSLVHARDFDLYHGRTKDEKIAWAAEKVQGFIAEFGTVDEFDVLWRGRCQKLPELFERESVRANLYKSEPVATKRVDGINDDWIAVVKSYENGDVGETTVTLRQVDDEEEEFATHETFESETAALRWIERVSTYHAPTEEAAAGVLSR